MYALHYDIAVECRRTPRHVNVSRKPTTERHVTVLPPSATIYSETPRCRQRFVTGVPAVVGRMRQVDVKSTSLVVGVNVRGL